MQLKALTSTNSQGYTKRFHLKGKLPFWVTLTQNAILSLGRANFATVSFTLSVQVSIKSLRPSAWLWNFLLQIKKTKKTSMAFHKMQARLFKKFNETKNLEFNVFGSFFPNSVRREKSYFFLSLLQFSEGLTGLKN